jgi:hypothetical protein
MRHSLTVFENDTLAQEYENHISNVAKTFVYGTGFKWDELTYQEQFKLRIQAVCGKKPKQKTNLLSEASMEDVLERAKELANAGFLFDVLPEEERHSFIVEATFTFSWLC